MSKGNRRALLLLAVAEAALLGWLALIAWGPNRSLAHPPLSFVDGLEVVAVFGAIGGLFVVSAAGVVKGGTNALRSLLAAALLAGAAIVGFVGAVLINASRCDTCDEA